LSTIRPSASSSGPSTTGAPASSGTRGRRSERAAAHQQGGTAVRTASWIRPCCPRPRSAGGGGLQAVYLGLCLPPVAPPQCGQPGGPAGGGRTSAGHPQRSGEFSFVHVFCTVSLGYTLYSIGLEFSFQYTAKKIQSNFLFLQSHWVITQRKCSRTDPEKVCYCTTMLISWFCS